MRLSRVFGISPEFAARLDDAHVRTLRDLANAADLQELSERSQVSLDLLEEWQATARIKVAVARRRRKAIAVLVAVTAILLATIAVWSYKKGLSHRLDEAIPLYNLGNDRYDHGDYDDAIAEYRKAVALKPEDADYHDSLGNAL